MLNLYGPTRKILSNIAGEAVLCCGHQMPDETHSIGDYIVCYACGAEHGRLAESLRSMAKRCSGCGGPTGVGPMDANGAHRDKDACITYLKILVEELEQRTGLKG